jgi:acyl-CoA synthetase (AMP-forming)/AMP-acid ligase II
MANDRGGKFAVAFTLVRSGALRPSRPDKTFRQLRILAKWGPTIAAGYLAAAVGSPQRLAVIDDRGQFTFAEIADRATRFAHGLAGLGVRAGSRVALLCRNHSGMLESLIACAFLGADAVLINTGLSAAQAAAVIDCHEIAVAIADEEFGGLLAGIPAGTVLVTAWHDGAAELSIDSLVAAADGDPLPPPARAGRIIVLTSGTTGVPKGARRPNPRGLGAAAAVLSRIPLRRGEKILVSAPLFHTWGFAAIQLGMPLHATLVLQRRFWPETAIQALHEHQCTGMFAIPVMLQRIVELPPPVRGRYPVPSLRIIASSGSAIPVHIVTAALEMFGDVLYNLYGSTEVSWASIAGPGDLRADPATAGWPPLGTRVAILGESGLPLPPGQIGGIFVGNDMLFEGYTSRGSQPRTSPGGPVDVRPSGVRGGLMSTGDRGFVDQAGRLFVSGRDDDMIVSGGENVFPREVEDVIAHLPGVLEAAVVGVPDGEYGQRFAAFVVPREGAHLDAEQIRAHVRERLARFSVPREVIFLPALPRNATGKVLRGELKISYSGRVDDTP